MLTWSEVYDVVEKSVRGELGMNSDEAPYGWDERLSDVIRTTTGEVMKLQEEKTQAVFEPVLVFLDDRDPLWRCSEDEPYDFGGIFYDACIVDLNVNSFQAIQNSGENQ